jgi:hypothetical protein
MVSSGTHGIRSDSTIRYAIRKQCLLVLNDASQCQIKKQKARSDAGLQVFWCHSVPGIARH